MARHNLATEFAASQGRINLGSRVAVAKAAHEEVRSVLQASHPLADAGLADALIGSYARDTAIWPGKDVDIFGKLTHHSVETIGPDRAYEMFRAALASRYSGRLTFQPRSIKIAFTPEAGPADEYLQRTSADRGQLFEFSVDVVPAVRFDRRWAIPRRDRDAWGRQSVGERWVETDPEMLTSLTTERNKVLTVAGQGAYVPTVKAVRQIRKYHFGSAKPGSLFYEFLLHEGFEGVAITGESWADITASALTYIAERLTDLGESPVCDPVLDTPYTPAPDASDLAVATARFGQLAEQAAQAQEADRCMTGALWRQVLGANGREPHDWVFPVPGNCREDGTTLPAAAAVNLLRGSNEARGFGSR